MQSLPPRVSDWFHLADFRHALEHVGFLVPRNADMAERHLDGFDLLRVVAASEDDQLARAPLLYAERGIGHFVLVFKAEHLDGPHDLRIGGIAYRRLVLHQDERVLLWVALDIVNHFERRVGRFHGAAPAAEPHVGYLASRDHAMGAAEVRRYQQAEVSDEQRAHRGIVLGVW